MPGWCHGKIWSLFSTSDGAVAALASSLRASARKLPVRRRRFRMVVDGSWIDMNILCVEEDIGEYIGETVAVRMNIGEEILLTWLYSSI
jgi:hypothetical protein